MATVVKCRICGRKFCYTPEDTWRLGEHLRSRHPDNNLIHFSFVDKEGNSLIYSLRDSVDMMKGVSKSVDNGSKGSGDVKKYQVGLGASCSRWNCSPSSSPQGSYDLCPAIGSDESSPNRSVEFCPRGSNDSYPEDVYICGRLSCEAKTPYASGSRPAKPKGGMCDCKRARARDAAKKGNCPSTKKTNKNDKGRKKHCSCPQPPNPENKIDDAGRRQSSSPQSAHAEEGLCDCKDLRARLEAIRRCSDLDARKYSVSTSTSPSINSDTSPRRCSSTDMGRKKDSGTDDRRVSDAYDRRNPDAYDRRDPCPYYRRHPGAYDRSDSGAYDKRDPGAYDSRDPGAYDRKDSGAYDRRDLGAGGRRDSVVYDRRDLGAYYRRGSGAYDRRDPGAYDKEESGEYDRRDSDAYYRRDLGAYDKRYPCPCIDARRDSGADARRDSGSDARRDSGSDARRDSGARIDSGSGADDRRDSASGPSLQRTGESSHPKDPCCTCIHKKTYVCKSASDVNLQHLEIKRRKGVFKATVETWRQGPTCLCCQKCGKKGQPLIRKRQNKIARSSLGALCLLGCWPFCFFPFIMSGSNILNLYCKNCGQFLGTYDRRTGDYRAANRIVRITEPEPKPTPKYL